jgi:hypothetical protein
MKDRQRENLIFLAILLSFIYLILLEIETLLETSDDPNSTNLAA